MGRYGVVTLVMWVRSCIVPLFSCEIHTYYDLEESVEGIVHEIHLHLHVRKRDA